MPSLDIKCGKCTKNTRIMVNDESCDPAQFTCSHCSSAMWTQRQWCPNCNGICIVADPQSFLTGKYSCPSCQFVDKLEPWYKQSRPKTKGKVPFMLKVYKRLLNTKKGPVLAHDSSLKCPVCDTDSIFWEIGNGARKICALCDKELP